MAKAYTSDKRAIDIRKLHREGLLRSGLPFSLNWSCNGVRTGTINLRPHFDSVTLDYRTRDRNGEWESMIYAVEIAWTPCNYGGQRPWWKCPAFDCGRRVAVLYGGKAFACRHCHKLVYRTQRDQAHDRANSRADRLRDRLGWEPGILNGNGDRPRGMHWSTFERLRAEHDALVKETIALVTAKFGRLRELLRE